jgi:outer membrane protein OmpA-like peptidoglycan-associated protein
LQNVKKYPIFLHHFSGADMNRIVFLFLVVILFVSCINAQRKKYLKDHAFSGTLVISVEGGGTAAFTDYKAKNFYNIEPDITARGMLEYFFPTSTSSVFGIRGFGGVGYIRGKDYSKSPAKFKTDLKFAGGALVYSLSFKDIFFPYLSAGASYLMFNPKGENGQLLTNNLNDVYDKNVITYDGELGIRFLVAENLSLNLSGSVHVSPRDYLDDKPIGTSNDFYAAGMAGVSISLFGKKDKDGDGIFDSEDPCPDDAEDIDGYEDSDGCPDYDNDSDGIPDKKDKCPNQKEDFDGFEDEDGCPDLDNDQDGILDVNDQCPSQPEDFDGYLDEDGCPDLDNDRDGILDKDDRCPNQPETKNGFEDEDGCPDEKPEPKVEAPKEIILSAGTNFTAGKSELLPGAYKELDKVVEVMKQNPDTRWRIEGHTDNKGSDKINKKISLARAQAVLNYFVSQGLNTARFEVFGLGKDLPIADNNTEEGRAKNRRVVILRID